MWLLDKFFKKKSNDQPDLGSVQMRPGYYHPFNGLNSYVPLKKQLELYKLMREAIPILDTAIYRLVRLVGTPKIEFESDRTQKEFDQFFDEVRVTGKNNGFKSFHNTYFDSMLQNGFAAGEILPNRSGKGIYALLNIDASTIRLKQQENNPLDLLVCQRQADKMLWYPFPQQDLILFTALNPEADDPHGVSLFRSLPFVSEVLLKIFNSLGLNWERFGNLRFQVVYKPDPNKGLDKGEHERRYNLLKKNWEDAMAAGKKGKVKDFVGVGDIDIKVIGADNQILDSQVPGRQMLEQIVSSTGLPPFMLGLHWSSTERMSSEQSDILTTELWEYRYALEPSTKEIVNWWKRLAGKRDDYLVSWEDINLKDEVELAKAEMMRQQARKNEISNIILLRNENIIDQQAAAEELGYEKPAGDPPALEQSLLSPKVIRYPKKQFMNDRHRQKYWKALKDRSHSHNSNKRYPDARVERLMTQFENEIMEKVQELEKRILDIIGLYPDGTRKAFDENGLFYLTEEEEQVVSQEIEKFINELIGDADEEYAGIYHHYLMESFKLGVRRARDAVAEVMPDLVDSPDPRVKPNWDHPYAQEMSNNGMALVQTRAREMRDRCLQIMKDHTARGDHPEVMARSLFNDLHEELGGKRWYWRRLARSESAMALDRADDAEYEVQGVLYVEWVAAPDACAQYCAPKHGKVWTMGNAPRVVADTHPHCRCRKRPVTARYALESGRLVP